MGATPPRGTGMVGFAAEVVVVAEKGSMIETIMPTMVHPQSMIGAVAKTLERGGGKILVRVVGLVVAAVVVVVVVETQKVATIGTVDGGQMDPIAKAIMVGTAIHDITIPKTLCFITTHNSVRLVSACLTRDHRSSSLFGGTKPLCHINECCW